MSKASKPVISKLDAELHTELYWRLHVDQTCGQPLAQLSDHSQALADQFRHRRRQTEGLSGQLYGQTTKELQDEQGK